MKNIIIILSFLLSLNLSAQTAVKKSNISSGGGIVTNGTTKIIYTLGETDLQETGNGTIHISEGFINPGLTASLGIENYTSLNNVKIFPNPASDFINIRFPEPGNSEILLSDINGKQIAYFSDKNVNLQKINIQNLPKGSYLLIIKNSKLMQVKIFKLIKQ